MATPHISASKGEIAPLVFMPGDPMRAQFIAEKYLDAPAEFNRVRGMYGYTGSYKGEQISVMGSGMGMPSIGIYSYELFTQYDVESIIRVGSAGAYAPELNLFDVLLVESSFSESTYAKTMNGYSQEIAIPSTELNEQIKQAAAKLGQNIHAGRVHSTDVFYVQDEGPVPYWEMLRDEKNCLAVEMESFALFHNAAATGKKAACLLTISDSFTSKQVTTAEQREKSFGQMIEIALETATL